MRVHTFTQLNQKQIISFLLVYRWTTLLFSLMIIFIQQGYILLWNKKLTFFVVLFTYNGLLTLFYRGLNRRNRFARIMTLGDIALGVCVVALSGDLTSPYFFYSLSAVFAYTFFYDIRGAIEGVILYIFSFLITSLLYGGKDSVSTDSLGNILIFIVQGLLFGVFCGFPSVLLHFLDRKSQSLEESRKNLIYLHEIACMMNVSNSAQEMVSRIMEMSREIFAGRKISIYLLKEKGIEVFGTPEEKDSLQIEDALREYSSQWTGHRKKESYHKNDLTLIPISAGIPLDGVIAIQQRKIEKVDQEDIALYTIVANMIGNYLENHRLVNKMREALLSTERNRIARDMHDGLAQSLFFFTAEIQNCRRFLDKKDRAFIEEKMIRLQKRMGESLQEVRSYIYNLREPASFNTGIEQGIFDLLDKVRQDYDIPIDLKINAPSEVPSETAHSILCIVQEGINNILKHAEAKHIKVYLTIKDEIILEIEDDGKGFDMEEVALMSRNHPKFGLQSMKERVEFLGGYFNIHTNKGEGTKLSIVIPNRKEDGKYGNDQIAYC